MIAPMIRDASAGRAPGSRPVAFLRRHLPLLLVLAVIAPAYLAWSGTAQMGKFASDGPNYLMMARHFAHPLARDVSAQVAAASRFPPLYPLILAWSGAAEDLRLVHAVTTAAFLLALVVLYAWLRGRGIDPTRAAIAVLLSAALPQSWLLGLMVQSEYLYLFWSLLALTLLCACDDARGHVRHERPGGEIRRELPGGGSRHEFLYAAALAVAAAALTRAIGVALLVPLMLVAWRAPPRRAAAALAIGLAPVAVWHLLHHAPDGYASQLLDIYQRAPLPVVLLAQLRRELPALQSGFLENFGGVAALAPALVVLEAACLAAAAWRVVQRRPDAAYLAAYAAILLIWPFPEEAGRFLWVIVPVLAAQPMLALAEWTRPAGGRLAAGVSAAIGALVLAGAVPCLARAAERMEAAAHSPLPDARGYVAWYQPDFDRARIEVRAEMVIVEDLRQLAPLIPMTDCVLAVRPELVSFYAGRRGMPVPLNSVPDPEFHQRLRASGCRLVFMSTRTDSDYPDVLHPLARLGDDLDVLYYNAMPNPPGTTQYIICMLARMK
jgi:hypothetical protein